MTEQLYALNDIYPSIQGEGCQTGIPMVIIRLHGCPVGCPFCDTKETWEREEQHKVTSIEEALGTSPKWCETRAENIAAAARAMAGGCKWALITGGEPADQPLENLVRALHDKGLDVALETSGTKLGHIDADFDWICVSPKFGMAGGLEVLPEAVKVADEIKHVVGKESDIIKLKEHLRVWKLEHETEICLQPMSASSKATELCSRECLEMGWRLSIQTHKTAGLR